MSDVHGARSPTVTQKWHEVVDQPPPKSGKKLGIVKREDPKVSSETVSKSRNLFNAFFSESVNNLGKALKLSPEQMKKLNTESQHGYTEIMKNTFGKHTGATMKSSEFSTLVRTAHTKAQQEIIKLTKEFGAPQLAPQIVPHPTKDGMKITVIKPSPPFENLVLRGGGAKGIGNGAVLVELEKSGAFSGLKQIVGTSAGALTAVGLASGMSATEFDKFAKDTDINSLKGSPSNFAQLYPMVDMGKRVGYTAGTALKTLDEVSSNQVSDRLSKNWDKVTAARDNGTITADQFKRLDALKEKADFTSDRSGKMVTFGDLRAMSKIFPEVKELTLTGMNRTDQELTYFSADSHPDMPIAVAGRISMSIPYFFASVSYDAGTGTKAWVDGGVGSNMPSGAVLDGLRDKVALARSELEAATKALDQDRIRSASTRLQDAVDQLEKVQSRTLLMTFDDGGSAYKKMHDPQGVPKTKLGRIDKLKGNVAGDKNWVLNSQQDTQNVRDAGPNVIVVHHGDIGTLDLDASELRISQATLESQMRTLERVVQHQNEATHQVFSDVDQVVASFTDQERQLLVQAGPPQLDQFKAVTTNALEAQQMYQTAKAVYDKVKELVDG